MIIEQVIEYKKEQSSMFETYYIMVKTQRKNKVALRMYRRSMGDIWRLSSVYYIGENVKKFEAAKVFTYEEQEEMKKVLMNHPKLRLLFLY